MIDPNAITDEERFSGFDADPSLTDTFTLETLARYPGTLPYASTPSSASPVTPVETPAEAAPSEAPVVLDESLLSLLKDDLQKSKERKDSTPASDPLQKLQEQLAQTPAATSSPLASEDPALPEMEEEEELPLPDTTDHVKNLFEDSFALDDKPAMHSATQEVTSATPDESDTLLEDFEQLTAEKKSKKFPKRALFLAAAACLAAVVVGGGGMYYWKYGRNTAADSTHQQKNLAEAHGNDHAAETAHGDEHGSTTEHTADSNHASDEHASHEANTAHQATAEGESHETASAQNSHEGNTAHQAESASHQSQQQGHATNQHAEQGHENKEHATPAVKTANNLPQHSAAAEKHPAVKPSTAKNEHATPAGGHGAQGKNNNNIVSLAPSESHKPGTKHQNTSADHSSSAERVKPVKNSGSEAHTSPTTKEPQHSTAKPTSFEKPTTEKTSAKKEDGGNKKQEKNTAQYEETKLVPKPVLKDAPASAKGIFTVQVYSTPSRDDAEDWIDRLKTKNVANPFITQQNVRGQTYYRVRFGSYPTRQEAESAAMKLGYASSWVDRVR